MSRCGQDKLNKYINFAWIAMGVILLLRMLINTVVSFTDESLFIAETLRLVDGDSPLIDNWDPGQTYAFILYPFAKLWALIAGKTTGIILFFRLIWFVLKAAFCVFFYKAVKEKDGVFAAFGVLFFFASEPYNMVVFSYNTIALLVSMYTIYVLYRENYSGFTMFSLGISWGLVVVAYPVYLLLIPAYVLVFVIKAFKKKLDDIYAVRSMLMLAAGGLLVGAAALLFVLSRGALADVLNTLPRLFDSPEHATSVGLPENWVSIARDIWMYLKIEFAIHIALCLIILFMRKQINLLVLPAVTAVCTLIMTFSYTPNLMNIWLINFFFMFIEECLILCKFHKDIRNKYLHILYWIFISVLCIATGTNTGILTPSGFLSMAAVVAMILFAVLVKRTYSSEKIAAAVNTVLVIAAFLMHLTFTWLRITISAEDYKNFVTFGPFAGTFMRDEAYEEYRVLYEDLNDFGLTDKDQLLCLTPRSLPYICSDAVVSTPNLTIGMFDMDMYYGWVTDYISERPEKKPTVVYLRKQDIREDMLASDLYKWICERYDMTESSSGIIGRAK